MLLFIIALALSSPRVSKWSVFDECFDIYEIRETSLMSSQLRDLSSSISFLWQKRYSRLILCRFFKQFLFKPIDGVLFILLMIFLCYWCIFRITPDVKKHAGGAMFLWKMIEFFLHHFTRFEGLFIMAECIFSFT